MSTHFSHVTAGQFQYPTLTIKNHEVEDKQIHFTAANGFPVAVYRHFLNQFSDNFNITATDCRGALLERNQPPKQFGFSGFADDLIQIIEALHDKPIIGMGHSFGAHISLIAAIKRPDLFDRLILIEPASLPNSFLDLYYRRLPKFLLHKVLPMIKRTQERRRTWPNRNAFVDKYRTHPTFKRFTKQALEAYAEYGLYQKSDDKFELVFDPDWEAYIFSNVEFIWKNLKKSTVPCLFLRAEHSNLYSSERFNKENRTIGNHFTGIEVNNTHHLMPLEKPELCYNTIRNWLLT